MGLPTDNAVQYVLGGRMLFPIKASLTVSALLDLDPVDVVRTALSDVSSGLRGVIDQITANGRFVRGSELASMVQFRDAMRAVR